MHVNLKGLAAGLGLSLAWGGVAQAQDELVIFWAEWDPANYLQELVRDYEEETGIRVVVETTPWADFQTKAFAEFNARGGAYDLIIGDSQWLGAASTGGHYVELTEFFEEHNVVDIMVPATIDYYAEYPANSERYWAIPAEGDALGWSYRKDLFNDPEEQEAFQEEYGYELDVPENWSELMDIAEFFHRPDEDFYGVAVYTDNSYDALAMGVENAIFSYGGDLGNRESYEVEGEINGEQAVKALEDYKELYSYTPPGWSNTFFVENNQAMTEGLVAMSMNYFAFMPVLLNEATNPYADDMGFFANPPGPTGEQFAALGGQGISIVEYSNNKEQAFDFLEWFIQPEVQERWAELGGYTTHAETLRSEEFRNATPYNEAFFQTMQFVKDFWAVPEYAELLRELNQRLYPYVVGGQGSAQEALDALAEDWSATFADYGRLEEE